MLAKASLADITLISTAFSIFLQVHFHSIIFSFPLLYFQFFKFSSSSELKPHIEIPYDDFPDSESLY